MYYVLGYDAADSIHTKLKAHVHWPRARRRVYRTDVESPSVTDTVLPAGESSCYTNFC